MAVSVANEPTQGVVSLVTKFTIGNGFTMIDVEAVAAQPNASITLNVIGKVVAVV